MNAMKRSLLALSATLALLAPAAAHAQWVTARSTNNIVCNAAWNQNHLVTVSDGAGGFVSVWQDQRNGRDDIYAQSVDANGFARWTTNGVVVDATVGTLFDMKACPDDSGGVIVSWGRVGVIGSDRIYAQRIDANGQRRWGAGGMRVSTAEKMQTLPRISRDEQGGAIVVWANWLASNAANVFGQRLDRDGNRLWSASGDSLVARGEVRSLTVTRRPGGGVFIGYWYTFGPLGMVAVDNARTRVMSDTITTATAVFSPPGLLSATAGNGAYLMMAGGTNMNIRWFGANGDRWPASRRVVGPVWAAEQIKLVGGGPDGSALLAWRDGRPNGGIYAQKIRQDGTDMWGANGRFITANMTENGGGHAIQEDGINGAWIVWSQNVDRVAQHVSSSGDFWLPLAGSVFSDANSSNFRYNEADIMPGVQSTAIVVWATTQDPGTYNDIHAKRMYGDGSLTTAGVEDGFAPGSGVALAAGPSPARANVSLRFALTRAGRATLELFGLQGERVATIADEAFSAGAHTRSFDTSALAPGVYLARLTTSEGVANAKVVRVR
ncbi:MAG: T9SS type A sorting domain-containing protein [Candidatus Eisenbacteria bacterium]|nr:T9SS type A sorting domain-containing protein [Candidatus Eisenbacteria bacterium]